MPTGRPGFMVYFADWRPLTILDDAQFRAVFDAASEFARTGETSDLKDSMANMALQMLLPRLEADALRYADRVAKAKAAARRSVEMRGMVESERSPTNASERQQAQPTESPITNHESPLQKDSLSQNYTERDRPSLEEVKAEAERAKLQVDAARFLEDMETDGWKDGKGELVRNWRKYLRGYAALNRGGIPLHGGKTPVALAYDQRTYGQADLSALTDAAFEAAASALKGGGDS